MKTTKNRKRVVNTAALGVSLLLSSTLLVGNAVSVYASPTISTDEQNAIDAFLATQPVDGDTRNIGATNPTPLAPSTYTFPGANNYVSVFRKPNDTLQLQNDYLFDYDPPGTHGHNKIQVRVKDWNTITWYKFSSTPEYISFHGNEFNCYFAKSITLIRQDDNTEFTVDYPTLLNFDESMPMSMSHGYINAHHIDSGIMGDMPIEVNDSRFKIYYTAYSDDYSNFDGEQATAYVYNRGYWRLEVPMEEKFSYDTIVQIDESLKTNETVVSEGDFGKKSTVFLISDFPDRSEQNYHLYTSDVIYNGLKTDFENATSDTTITDTFGWVEFSGDVHFTSPTNRIIRVGVDYTHYVADDGTVLKPIAYGLNPVDTIAGYQFVSSHREANGDLVHVYTIATTPVTPVVPSTPSTPSSPVTPSSPSTPATVSASPRTMDKSNLFVSVVMLMVGVFTSVGVFFTRNKRA